MKTKRNTTTFSFTLPNGLAEKMEATIKASGMSRSSYLAMSVTNQMNAEQFIKDLPATIEAIRKQAKEEVEQEKVKDYYETSDGSKEVPQIVDEFK